MHKFFKTILVVLVLLVNSHFTFAQSQFWQDGKAPNTLENDRQIVPNKFRTLQLALADYKKLLLTAPNEFTPEAQTQKTIIELPLPYGGFSRFYIYRSSIMEKPLADQFPQIQTFACQGIDDPYATARIDYTEKGFHAMVLSPNGCYFIDPYAKTTTEFYISYYKKDFTTQKVFFEEGVLKQPQQITPDNELKNKSNIPAISLNKGAVNRSNGTQLYTYRIAIAATGEYSTYHGGTIPLVLSAQITTLNRVTAVYRTELAISFNLIANNTSIIYLNASTDPYTNTNGSTMLGQNQTNLTSVIGAANYDIGHVFSTGGGGVAMLASVCSSTLKAQGVTGSSAPIGDPFDIDYVAHEMGHQFGGNHSFNGNTGSCSGGNRNATTAYEPGSGSTIMAYAGICSPQDLQLHSDPYFHTVNFDEIITNITTGATGLTGCAAITASGNTPPIATVAATAYTIPYGTPFMLSGTGSDSNGDSLTFYWEQFDLGSATAPNTPSTAGPRFRSYSPTISPTRIVPNYSNLLAGTTPIGEILPTASQTAKFRFTARDNRTVGGGVYYDPNYTTVTFATVGPFTVNTPSTVTPNTNFTVTWNVNGSNTSPINCSAVKVSLSTDGGNTFGYILSSSTANDGTESLQFPNISTTNARLKVEAVGNIFFNISGVFIIGVIPPPTITSFTPTIGFQGDTIKIIGTNFNGTNAVSFGSTAAASFIVNSSTQISAVVGSGSSGSVQVTTTSGNASLAGFTLGDSTIGVYKPIGTGTTSNTATTYPAPYGNYYGGVRHQMIYLASELTAQGLSAGLISQFGFNVSTLVAGSLNGFTLKIGTTSSTTLSAFATTGLTTVFTTTDYTASQGWNMHNFSTPFYWNGTSNIIIEVCFNNNNTGVSGNTTTVQTTGLSSSICRYYNADATTTVCTNTSSTAATSRPNGRFFLTKTPVTLASNMVFTNLTNTSVTVTFTKGSGGKRIVVCRPTSAAAVAPTNLINYTANATYGIGNSTGANNFVVYNNNGNSVTVTGLSLNTSYTFTVYEYNGLPSNTAYQTTGFSGSPVTTLPVTWRTFEAKRNEKQVVLNWSTASEQNNQFFAIERSINNQTWEQINTVKAIGNSNIVNTYSYIDFTKTYVNQDLYYRLKQVDFDGKFTYSNTVIALYKNDDNQAIAIKPNPSNGKFTLVSPNTSNTDLTIKVFNNMGLEVYKQNATLAEINMDLSYLPKGAYSILVLTKTKEYKTSILIQ